MFGIFEDLAKVAVGVVKTPITVVADVITLGGSLTDKRQPYTMDNIKEIVENLEHATKPNPF